MVCPKWRSGGSGLPDVPPIGRGFLLGIIQVKGGFCILLPL